MKVIDQKSFNNTKTIYHEGHEEELKLHVLRGFVAYRESLVGRATSFCCPTFRGVVGHDETVPDLRYYQLLLITRRVVVLMNDTKCDIISA
jgi:hypothetical protein